MRDRERDGAAALVGAKPMLLWYVWIRLTDGAWHQLEDIAKQLHLPKKAVEWAGNFLCDKGMAETGGDEGEIRLHQGTARFEDAVKALVTGSKSEQSAQ